MLPRFADTPVQFPHAGSQAFIKATAEPVTIIRINADGSAFVRHDPRPGQIPNRDASGNSEIRLGDLFGTEVEAAWAALPASKRPAHIDAKLQRLAKSRSATSGPQGRPAARSAPRAGAKQRGRAAPGA